LALKVIIQEIDELGLSGEFVVEENE